MEREPMNATPALVKQIIDPSLDAFPNWKAWATAASDWIVASFSDDLGNHLTRSFSDDEK